MAIKKRARIKSRATTTTAVRRVRRAAPATPIRRARRKSQGSGRKKDMAHILGLGIGALAGAIVAGKAATMLPLPASIKDMAGSGVPVAVGVFFGDKLPKGVGDGMIAAGLVRIAMAYVPESLLADNLATGGNDNPALLEGSDIDIIVPGANPMGYDLQDDDELIVIQ